MRKNMQPKVQKKPYRFPPPNKDSRQLWAGIWENILGGID
jgi:hypothetical protein